MSDDFYKKQLSEFGIEQTRIITGDIEKKRQAERHEASIAVVKSLMDNMQGRQWLYSVLDMCKTFTTPFVAGSPDATAFFCGAQAIGQKLLEDIMIASPENFFVMITEEAARKKPVE